MSHAARDQFRQQVIAAENRHPQDQHPVASRIAIKQPERRILARSPQRIEDDGRVSSRAEHDVRNGGK